MLERVVNFPAEIGAVNSWYVADSSGAPCKQIGSKLVPVDPQVVTPYSFSEAYQTADEHDALIGFYLRNSDPFTCIDMDIKDANDFPNNPEKWTSAEDMERFGAIMRGFPSYSEVSRNGKGAHVWIRGSIGAGVRKGHLEVYSQQRFIICTGNHIAGTPLEVVDHTLEIISLANWLRGGVDANQFQLVEVEPTEEDFVVYERAQNAGNSEKFKTLAEQGNWGAYYPSQSEADLSLMSMFTFYSKSNSQCVRLFRSTALGAREKANKNDYHMNRLLRICRSRIESEDAQAVKDMEHGKELAQSIIDSINKNYEQTGFVTPPDDSKEMVDKHRGIVGNNEVDSYESEIDWPPGFAGALAKFLYSASIRPVKEIAIITALSALAGMIGKAYNIPRSGLNMYFVLIARSAIGKESMHSGLSLIQRKIADNAIAGADCFFDFNSYVSGPALIKAAISTPSNCFININSEWGKQMERIANEPNNGALQSLKQAMTSLYQKSDADSTVGGMGYSNKENNVSSARGVAYSMVGESTPESYYSSLDRTMMEDGFLSRFTAIEYKGKRPARNMSPLTTMQSNMLGHLVRIANECFTMCSAAITKMVPFNPEALEIEEAFNDLCDKQINLTDDEALRQIWNRAHLKVLRLSALMACADAPENPIVYPVHVNWAKELIELDMKNMLSKVQEGAVGKGDEARFQRVMDIILKYMRGERKAMSIEAKRAGIIMRADLQRSVYSYAAFRNHRAGAGMAFDSTMRQILDMGYLVDINPKQAADHNLKGKAYVVTDQFMHYIEELENAKAKTKP